VSQGAATTKKQRRQLLFACVERSKKLGLLDHQAAKAKAPRLFVRTQLCLLLVRAGPAFPPKRPAQWGIPRQNTVQTHKKRSPSTPTNKQTKAEAVFAICLI
jgi:hypothetical protein